MQNLQTFVILDLDHPGAQDMVYKERRNQIADLSNNYWSNAAAEVPSVVYTEEEEQTWQNVWQKLRELWPDRASKIYLQGQKNLDIDFAKIPQMLDLNQALKKASGFKLRPVAGLVESRAFLGKLADNVMLCTQYIRHHSKPEFTPEPDLIHEFMGHVPTFADTQIARISNIIGQMSMEACPEKLAQLEKIYWFTLEYGLIEEKGKIKAIGAGLLAGLEDQNRAFASDANLRDFDLDEITKTAYDFSKLQDFYYVLPSLDHLEKELLKMANN